MIIGNSDIIPDKIGKIRFDISDHNPHLLGSFLDRKQPNICRDVIVFVNSISSVQSGVAEMLALNISSSCSNGYDDVMWENSCGENSLHRLCHLVRFRAQDEVNKKELILYVQNVLIMASNSAAAKAVNNWDETPLHLFLSHCGFDADENASYSSQRCACIFQIQFLNELMLSFPQSLRRSNYLMALPLHEACKLSQLGITAFPYKNTSAIKLLEDDRSYRNDIHLEIVKALVKLYPDALFHKDCNGKTALHDAVESLNCNSEVVLYLWEQMLSFSENNIALLDEITSELMMYLHRLFDACLIEREKVSPYDNGRKTLCLLFLRLSQSETIENIRVWKKLRTLMSLLYHGSTAHIFEFPIHACIFSDAPIPILQMISVIYRSDIMSLSSDGESPLTFLLNRKSNKYEMIVKSVAVLLEADRRLAQIPDAQRRLPLHIILDRLGWSDLALDIFLSYRGAASIQDPVTHLWPFMLAAARVDCISKCATDILTGIYNLLRDSPSVLLNI